MGTKVYLIKTLIIKGRLSMNNEKKEKKVKSWKDILGDDVTEVKFEETALYQINDRGKNYNVKGLFFDYGKPVFLVLTDKLDIDLVNDLSEKLQENFSYPVTNNEYYLKINNFNNKLEPIDPTIKLLTPKLLKNNKESEIIIIIKTSDGDQYYLLQREFKGKDYKGYNNKLENFTLQSLAEYLDINEKSLQNTINKLKNDK